MNKERIARQCICCSSIDLKKAPAVLMPFVAKRVFDHDPVRITPEWGMNDLQEGMAYSVCNTIQCTDCDALFLDIRFTDEEMAALYKNYRDEEYNRLRIYFEPGYAQRIDSYAGRSAYIRQVEDLLRPVLPASPSILDWGGNTGVNTPLLGEAGLVHVYDISQVPTIDGAQAVDLATVQKNGYDLIVCSQVLEHVSYPAEIVSDIVSVMREDTLFYLELPYEKLMRERTSLTDLYKDKRHWHEHINFFSEKSILALLQRAGLQLVEMRAIDVVLGSVSSCARAVLCRRA